MINNEHEIILSICIATYNRSAMCLELVHEIMKYPSDDIEIVVCDNHSTDDTWDALSKINDPRVHIFRNDSNYGADYNWLNALFHGNGKYVMRMNDREFFCTQALAPLINDLKSRTVDVVVACGRKPFEEFTICDYENKACLVQKLGEPGEYFYSGEFVNRIKAEYQLSVNNYREVWAKLYDISFQSEQWYWYYGERILQERSFQELKKVMPVRKSNGYVFTGFPEGQRAICVDMLSYLQDISIDNRNKYLRGVINAYARLFFGTTWRSMHNSELCERYGVEPPKCYCWVYEIGLWIHDVKEELRRVDLWNRQNSRYVKRRIWTEYIRFLYQRFCDNRGVKRIVEIKHQLFR